MYYIFGEPADAFLGYFLEKSKKLEIDENLRGWNDSDQVKPPSDLQLPMYIVASRYCESARDIYLQFVKHIRPAKTKPLLIGSLLHAVMSRVVPIAKQYIYQYTSGISDDFNLLNHMLENRNKIINEIIEENKNEVRLLLEKGDLESVREKMLRLWNFQAMQIVASVDLVLSKHMHIEPDALVSKAIPIAVEQKLDGSRIGLSKQLSVDALQVPQTVVMDIKTGRPKDFHRLTVAGYALAYESEYRNPVNLGCIIYPSFIKGKSVPYIRKEPFLIDNKLRHEFIEERNRKMRIILDARDPGLARTCSRSCGFWKICHEGK